MDRERCRSGRSGRTRNAVYGQLYRGFESLSLRKRPEGRLGCKRMFATFFIFGVDKFVRSGELAVRVGELQLRVVELERYRADDAALIRDMGEKKKELEQLTEIQQQTIYKLQGEARDTVFIEFAPDGSAEVPARCAEHHDEWLDFSCCIFPDNSYKADVISRDRITYLERVQYARLLGFLWRTKRVKSCDQFHCRPQPARRDHRRRVYNDQKIVDCNRYKS